MRPWNNAMPEIDMQAGSRPAKPLPDIEMRLVNPVRKPTQKPKADGKQ